MHTCLCFAIRNSPFAINYYLLILMSVNNGLQQKENGTQHWSNTMYIIIIINENELFTISKCNYVCFWASIQFMFWFLFLCTLSILWTNFSIWSSSNTMHPFLVPRAQNRFSHRTLNVKLLLEQWFISLVGAVKREYLF